MDSPRPLVHPPPPPWPRRRLWAFLLWTAIGLAALEGLARLAGFPPTEEARTVTDWEVGWLYRPHFEWVMNGWNPRIPDRVMRINSRGLRGERDYPTPREDGEVRVLCLGDSNTNQYHTDAWPEYLQRLLETALPGRPVWVQNAGVAGFTTDNALALARREIPAFEPDFVALLVGVHDMMIVSRPASDEPLLPPLGEVMGHVSQLSAFTHWIRALAYQEALHPLGGRPADVYAITTEDPVHRVPLDRHAQNLRELAAVCRDHGATLIVISTAFRRPEVTRNLNGAGYAATANRVAAESGAIAIDLLPHFERPDRDSLFLYSTLGDWETDPGFLDDVHFNGRASEFTAALVAQGIADRLADESPGSEIRTGAIARAISSFAAPSPPGGDEGRVIPPAWFLRQQERGAISPGRDSVPSAPLM